jgi:RimJ/RimL family protein N-acetyltransferase
MSVSAPPRPQPPQLATLPLELETPRLVLRPLAATDLDALHAHAVDPALSRFMSWSAPTDRDETRAFIERQLAARAAGTDVVWTILREGRASGCIGLHGITWRRQAWRVDRADLGYWLAIPLWGQGLMSEAATAVVRWAFETAGLHKLTVGCLDGNVASQKVIEKLGFRFLALHEDDVWRDGRWWHRRCYEMLAAEWGDTTRTLRFRRPDVTASRS